jgi:hypothetical protein
VTDAVIHEPTEPTLVAIEAHSQIRRLEALVRWANEKARAFSRPRLRVLHQPHQVGRLRCRPCPCFGRRPPLASYRDGLKRRFMSHIRPAPPTSTRRWSIEGLGRVPGSSGRTSAPARSGFSARPREVCASGDEWQPWKR